MPEDTPKPRYKGKSPHGSPGRYAWELHILGTGCPVCKAANAKRTAEKRNAARQKEANRIIEALRVPENTGVDSGDSATCTNIEGLGPTTNAALDDLNHINRDVPFYLTYRAAVLALAMEIDDPKSRAAKGPLVKQLTDTLRELKASGGGARDSFKDFLEDLAAPLVPADIRDGSEPGESDARPEGGEGI